MKSKLSCNVVHCTSNCDNCCCRNEIQIGGRDAKCSGDTCCHSFTDIPHGVTNDIGYRHPNKSIAINCEATDCIYNKNKKCDATDVSVKNPNACSCGETECATFQPR